MWTIREAQPEDARAIAEVHVASWKSSYAGLIPEEYLATLSVEKRAEMWAGAFRQREKDPRCKTLFVCEDAHGQIQGFVAGGVEREQGCGYGSELYAIYLQHELQRSGAGSLLTQKLAQWLQSHGYRNMRVWVLEQNPSRAFYERLGGALLPETKTVEFGGKTYIERAYGWGDLSILSNRVTFKPIDLQKHRETAITFREDSFICSFGDARKFWEQNGPNAEKYISWLEEKLKKDPALAMHVWQSNRIVGQMELGAWKDDPTVGYINLYYLAPEARGTGLSKALDDYAVRTLRAKGHSEARLCVSPSNARALRYYLRMGWSDLGVRPDAPEVRYMQKML
jgi:L-amino acid N-acyltransferase YncA